MGGAPGIVVGRMSRIRQEHVPTCHLREDECPGEEAQPPTFIGGGNGVAGVSVHAIAIDICGP